MDSIFVERRLELRGGGEVIVRFFHPEPREVDYGCCYQIIWPDRGRRFQIYGIDAVQALVLAMQVAHAELLSSPESKDGRLLWLGDRDLGLPSSGQARGLRLNGQLLRL
jgi:hypothetical protein